MLKMGKNRVIIGESWGNRTKKKERFYCSFSFIGQSLHNIRELTQAET